MKQNYKSGLLIKILTLLLITGMISCTKFVQVDPPVTQISAATVYSDNGSAASVMTGMYSNISEDAQSATTVSIGNISYLQGLSADELTNYSNDPVLVPFYTNSLSSFSIGASNNYYWLELYNEIHVANALLEGVAGSTGVTASVKKQLNGEAKFMRAFLNFYATNFYGDVPLVTTTDYLTNNTIKRSPQTDVYHQIISDLLDAQAELPADFVDPSGKTTTERARPNSGAATALLARAYLYTEKWDSAEAQATLVINNGTSYSLDSDLNNVFLANSSEAIWQLAPVVPGYNTFDAINFVLSSPPGSYPSYVSLSTQLLQSFEPNDKRRQNWVGAYTTDSINYFYYPFKYKVVDNADPSIGVTEYTMVLRLAEQYLIRAEARVQQGNVTGAQADLNTIRTRAGLPNTDANSASALLTAILHERQVELFTEWGHRWFDLIRTGNVNSVMGSPGNVCNVKGGTWSPDWALLPLPQMEIQINPNLKQNPGY